MTLENSTQEWLEQQLCQTPEYEAERLTLLLIGQCEERRAELGWSYAELSRRMGVTRAYVSKLMGGVQNSTIESLVKLARALECELRVDLICKAVGRHGAALPERPAARKVLVATVKPSGRYSGRRRR